MMPKKLFLIDGSAQFYRSYFAFIRNPLINSKGENTSATFGFMNAMVRLIEDEAPDYLAIVFDTKEPTFRHEMFPEYKATRERMPEEMAAQYPRLISTLKACNFTLLEKAGFEADDIIGTLARKYASKDLLVYIVSGDKDMAQLVNDHVFIYNPGKTNQPPDILDKNNVRDRLGVDPYQVIDWLALMGDSSDNIPGVPKVGKKTAGNLLSEFGSLDNLYKNIDQLKESVVKRNLIEYQQQTHISRNLATIETAVDLDTDLGEIEFKMWDMDVVDRVLKELEFRSLFNRMLALAQTQGQVKEFTTHTTASGDYKLIRTREEFEQLLAELRKQGEFVFDLETDSLDFLVARIAGIALSWKEGSGFYIPLRHPDISLDNDWAFDALRPVFADPGIKKIAHNIKFDTMILEQNGLPVEGIYFDTMIAAYLINPTGQHKLDKVSEYYLNYEMIHIEELIGSGKKQKLMTDIPAEEVAVYAAEDADITLKLYHILKKKISELGMEELLYNLEMPLVRVLMTMEARGVKLDLPLLHNLSLQLEKDISSLVADIYRIAGQEFNLNSPQQLGTILYEQLEIHKQLGLRKPPKTKTGQYSTAEKTLERYSEHEVVDKILNYRQLTKLKNTYVDALPNLVSAKTGRVHTSYNQTVAATGRLSSSNPNLQNIPVRTEIGREMRRAFIPSEPDWLMVSADYSQIELRLMAHLSGDATMTSAFKQNQDIHSATAALIFGIAEQDVTPDHRRKAKEINFGIIYGMSRFGLASRLNISNDEAEEFISNYFATYPDIYRYMQNTISLARQQGYVETMLHRRRYLPEINSTNRQIKEVAERTAINTPIQGSAADLIKKAMIDINHFIADNALAAHMLLQVHDELVFEVARSEAEPFARQVKQIMEKAFELSVPVVVDAGIGRDWLEAH